MVKFTAKQRGGGVLVGLGLSRANVERMTVGARPVYVRGRELVAPGQEWLSRLEVLIFFGETEEDMQRDLAGSLTPGAIVRRDETFVPAQAQAEAMVRGWLGTIETTLTDESVGRLIDFAAEAIRQAREDERTRRPPC